MERKFLEDLGIDKANVDKIMAEYGKDINAVKAAEGAKLQAANDTISKLQDTVKKYDGVDVDKLKGDLQATEAKYKAEISKLQLDHALETAITKSKAKSVKAVKAFLDLEKIKLDGDKLLGFDDQLKAIKESEPYLFDAEDNKDDKPGEGAPGGNAAGAEQSRVRINTGGTHGGGTDVDYDKMSDAEYYATILKKKE